MTEEDQPLPAAVDAERALLGSILMNGELFAQASDLIGAVFYLDSHRRIWHAMHMLAWDNRPIDIITVSQFLQQRKEVEAIGGVAYLASLSEGLPRRAHIGEYVKMLKEKATLRWVIQQADRTRTRALDQSEDAETVLADTRAEWDALSLSATENKLEPIGVWMGKTYASVDDYSDRSRRGGGLMTGFAAFDHLTGGLQRKDLVIIAARPSMGKTAWAGNVADSAAVKQRKVVAFFSLEMSTEALLDRMACSRAQASLSDHRAGTLSRVCRSYFNDALADLMNETLLLIDDETGQTVRQMESKAARAKQEYGALDLIVVDHVGLIAPGKGGSKNENREQQVAGNSRALKAMAKKLDVPVVALAQLSRALDKRADKRPILSDLRESGSLEQDADVVAFIHREEYYAPKEEGTRGRAELIIAKQRNGPLGTAHVYYQDRCTRFSDTDPSFGYRDYRQRGEKA
jgi:replicative DNA helicase